METTKSRSWWVVVGGVVLIAGVVTVGLMAYGTREQQPPVMSREKFMETFKDADKADRENWDRMWKEAGKKPPPAGR